MSIFLFNLNSLADDSKDPQNWCRWGTFFNDDWPDYKIVKITQKTNFYSDEDFKKQKSYLVKDDLALLSRTFNEFSCLLYPKSDTIGWIKTDDIQAVDIIDKYSEINNWIGKWRYLDGISFELRVDKGNKLVIDGNACCFGYGQNVASIESDNSKIIGNKITFNDPDDCSITLIKINDFIVAKDDNQCGGLNASFTGVYSIIN